MMGVNKRIFLGITHSGCREVVRLTEAKPDLNKHPSFKQFIGPFQTLRAATWMIDNPVPSVAEAEKMSKKLMLDEVPSTKRFFLRTSKGRFNQQVYKTLLQAKMAATKSHNSDVFISTTSDGKIELACLFKSKVDGSWRNFTDSQTWEIDPITFAPITVNKSSWFEHHNQKGK